MRKAAFICYRRADTAASAGRIRDFLLTKFPNRIFMDTADIAPGSDFVEEIERTVGRSHAVIVLIGRKWLDLDGMRRLGEPGDYVTFEIRTALERGLPTIPILLEGAAMPSENDLPAPIQGLARSQAIEIRHASFGRDVEELAKALYRVLDVRPPAKIERWVAELNGQPALTERQRDVYAAMGGLIAVVFLLGSILAPDSELESAVFFSVFFALVWPFGRNSARLGVLTRAGLALVILGILITFVRVSLRQ
jgi:hypothetical protein